RTGTWLWLKRRRLVQRGSPCSPTDTSSAIPTWSSDPIARRRPYPSLHLSRRPPPKRGARRSSHEASMVHPSAVGMHALKRRLQPSFHLSEAEPILRIGTGGGPWAQGTTPPRGRGERKADHPVFFSPRCPRFL